MRRALKWIGWAVLVVAGVTLVTAVVLAWRATRVPAWYAAARDIAPNDPLADDAVNRRLIPLQNWLARTSAGDLDDKHAADKQNTLTLTQDEVNALLAKGFDHVHGRFERYRVRLTDARIDLACDWTDYGRTVGLNVLIDQPADAGPHVSLGRLRVGTQAVPQRLLAGSPLAQLRAALAEPMKRTKPNRIDEHDLAGPRTVTAYYGRMILDLLAGGPVEPLAFLPGSPTGDDLVATKIDRLDVTDGAMTITFRMLGPDDRTNVLAALDAAPSPP